MKKVIFFLTAVCSFSLSAQTIFNIRNYDVPQKNWNTFLELHDNYFGDIEFKSGGVVIDWIRIGDGEFNIRVGRYGDMNNWGIKTDLSEYEGPNFWTRRNLEIEDSGPSYAGTSVYRQGEGGKHNTQQRWFLKVQDPTKFLAAFKAFLKENKKVFGDRWISLVAYTIAGPKGATHSVAMSGESWMELEQVRAKVFANGSAEKFLNARGSVEDVYSVMHRRMRHYNNERNKAKTYKEMW